eukprot:155723-Pyramimonas_sp.AAC.3
MVGLQATERRHEETARARDCLAEALYEGLFALLVARINGRLAGDQVCHLYRGLTRYPGRASDWRERVCVVQVPPRTGPTFRGPTLYSS